MTVFTHDGRGNVTSERTYDGWLQEHQGDHVVTETYRYAGRGGRVSERHTRVSHGGETKAFRQTVTWDPLGNVSQLGYPRCEHADCQDA